MKVFLLLILFISGSVFAAPIQYEWWGTVSGSIGTTTFQNESIYFDVQGQTSIAQPFENANTSGFINIIAPTSPSGLFAARVTIGGVGTADIVDNLQVVANPNEFCRCIAVLPLPQTGSGDLFSVANTVFDLANPYDLTTSTALITGTAFTFGSLATVSTSLGTLQLNGASDGSFRATLIPIPPTLWLFGSAFGLLGWMRHRLTV